MDNLSGVADNLRHQDRRLADQGRRQQMSDIAQLKAAMLAVQAEREAWIKVQGEGARDWTPMDDREASAVRAYTAALWAAEWTLETIAARRESWNAWVAATGTPTWAQIVARQDAQGWTLNNLKLAIDRAKRVEG